MRFSVVYLVLVSFTFLSLTPAGVSLAELRAEDSFEIEELDLGLGDDEESGSSEKEEKSEDAEKEDESDGEESSGEKESSESSEDAEGSEDPEESEEAPVSLQSSKADDAEAYTSTGKKIMAFYVFEDSVVARTSSHVSAETASYLAGSKEFDYIGIESVVFASSSSWLKSAKKDLADGKKLYNDLAIEEAIVKFKSALKTLENNIDKLIDIRLVNEAILYLGASYALIEEDEDAEAYFYTYISMNPDDEMTDAAFSDEVVSAFDDVKSSFKGADQGSVDVKCSEEGALVFIDGKIAGMTPVTLRNINYGKHYFRIHKNGFRDVGGAVLVRGDQTVTINETMTRNPSASSVAELEDAIKSEFGSLAMLRKATDLAQETRVDNVFIVKTSIGADKKLQYQGYMVDAKKKEFKKSEAVFAVPDKSAVASLAALKQFNKTLINDPYEYKAISDLVMEEADLLGLSENADNNKSDEDKKPIYKEWWLWTVVGVVVLAGVGVGTYFALTSGKDGSNGATLDVNFQ